MKKIYCLSPVLLLATMTYAQNFNFKTHEIGRHGQSMGQTALVDVDKDGDLDWVYGLRGKLFWYEYQSPAEWVHHELGSGAKTDVGGCPIDINNDGWIDFMVGDSWYQNTGNPRQDEFTFNTGIGTITCHDNIAVDINGDGKLDIAAVSNDPGQKLLMWYETSAEPNKKWKATQIGEGIHGGIGPKGFGDLDGDGDIDIVRGNIWYENVDGRGGNWTPHEDLIPAGGNRPDIFGLALKSWVIDLDGDGDLDIIEAEADTPNGRIFWFENRKHARKWRYHVISQEETGQDFHSLAVADFDNDGDVDIFSGGGPLSTNEIEMFIWENKESDGSLWIEHPLIKGKMCHEAVAGDVDGDGDIDICTKPWKGDDLHLYLENKLIDVKNENQEDEN